MTDSKAMKCGNLKCLPYDSTYDRASASFCFGKESASSPPSADETRDTVASSP